MQENLVASQHVELSERADALCHWLGYTGRSTYYASLEAYDRDEAVHVVSTAFRTIGAHSVFGLTEGSSKTAFKPLLYVGIAADKEAAKLFHRRVWSQGVVPIILLVTPDGIQVRHGFEPPEDASVTFQFNPEAGAVDPRLENVSALSLTTSSFWNDFSASRTNAIDTSLVSSIGDLNRYARSKTSSLHDRPALVNALIGRFLYLYTLVDRGIVDEAWMKRTIKKAGCRGDTFAEAVFFKQVRVERSAWAADEAWAVFDGVDRLINGSVFPISSEDRALLSGQTLQDVHRVVRCGDVIRFDGHQINFLDVSFEVLRTETISAIYQRFIQLEDGVAQRNEGAFYTPPFLADFIVAHVDAEVPLDRKARVVDPAAGSGVFLVSAYRRIMERSMPEGGWSPASAELAGTLLSSCVFGMEKNLQAANVCRFSLYLTLLDYVGGAPIEELARAVGDRKLLPKLEANIIVCDALEGRGLPSGGFTHVVGNPPWARSGRLGAKRNQFGSPDVANVKRNEDPDGLSTDPRSAPHDMDAKTRRPVLHGRLSDRFTWLALDVLASPDAVIGLILPTTSVVGRQSKTFAAAVASAVTLRLVANLSHLRYRLFVNARASATVVVARNRLPDRLERVCVYRPRLPSLPVGRTGNIWSLLVSQTDLQSVRIGEFQDGDNGWLGSIMFGALDRRMRFALKISAHVRERTVGDFLRRSGLRMQRGGSSKDIKIPERYLEGHAVAENLFPITDAEFSRLPRTYQALFAAPVLLVPRKPGGIRLLEEPHAFSSTYYGIAASERWTDVALTLDAKPKTDEERLRTTLHCLSIFMSSATTEYFVSIFGATYLMEKARIEKGDILTLPCPFESADDPAFRSLRKESADAAILDAMEAGEDLRRAVADFQSFNARYADGQLPPGAFDTAEEGSIDAFVVRLTRELAGSFTERFASQVRIGPKGKGTVCLTIGFGQTPKSIEHVPNVDALVASSIVSFDRPSLSGQILKSEARFAWTAEQAVADAEALVSLVGQGMA